MNNKEEAQQNMNKRFSLSILLWMRTDKPRSESMDYWKGPYARIIASSPQLLEYRQHHLDQTNHSFWPRHESINTVIPEDRRVDGIAEVTYQRTLSPLFGRKQTALAFNDEVNIFRRSLMHMGLPWSSRWYFAPDNAITELRDVIFVQRKQGVSRKAFKRLIRSEIPPLISKAHGISELRSQIYIPWHRLTWNTPNVAHDNPKEQQLHASFIIGFRNNEAREEFYRTTAGELTSYLNQFASSVFTYKVEQTIPFVVDATRTQ